MVLADLRSPLLFFIAFVCLMTLAQLHLSARYGKDGNTIPNKFSWSGLRVWVWALVVVHLILCLWCLAWESVDFARQVRAQWGMTADQKRRAHLQYQTGLDLRIIRAVAARVPEDASIVLLWDETFSSYQLSLIRYYLAPRHVYLWWDGSSPPLKQGNQSEPGSAWLRTRRIDWILVCQNESLTLREVR